MLGKGGASIGLKAVFAFLGFATSVMLARLLGPSGLGVYVFALSIITIISLPAQIGLPQLAVRETAKQLGRSNYTAIYTFWRWAFRTVTVFSLFVSLLMGAVLYFALGGSEDTRSLTILMGIVTIPLLSWAKVQSACLRGLGYVVIGQVPENLVKPGLFLLLLAAAVTITPAQSIGPLYTMGLYVVAAVLTLILSTWLLIRMRPVREEGMVAPAPKLGERSEWRQAIIPLAMIGGLQLVNNYTDLIMLGFMRDDAEVGIYRSASQLAVLVVFGLQAFNQILQPQFSLLWNTNRFGELQSLLTVSSRIIFLLALPPAIIFFIFGEMILSVTFGAEFAAGYAALVILATGQVSNAFGGSVGALLNMTGHERETLMGIAVSALLNIGLNIVLIPPLGMIGAAVATACSLASWNLILVYRALGRLKLDATPLGFLSRNG